MAQDASRQNHLYGGQALIEGVMMRGREHWAVAVRKPDESIHLESHEIDSVAKRHPILAKPLLRGVTALGQTLAIGYRALTVSIQEAHPEEDQLSGGQMVFSVVFAVVLFAAVFIVLPAVGFGYAEKHWLSSGLVANLLEGVFRVLLLLGYLMAISRMKDVRRMFQYHGAEHKTIAAYEHHDELTPANVDEYSTLHIRCGTSFLLSIVVLTIFIFALMGTPPMAWRVISRLAVFPIIAAIAYEVLRLGARFPNSPILRIMSAPGLWLQKITTKPPDTGQIEVAIASFEECLRAEAASRAEDASPETGSDLS